MIFGGVDLGNDLTIRLVILDDPISEYQSQLIRVLNRVGNELRLVGS